MKKLTPEEFASMNCRDLRKWVAANCVQRPAGRPKTDTAMTDAERARRYRERRKRDA